MEFFKKYEDKTSCWWCGYKKLSGEHKSKKTSLEILYGKVYGKNKRVSIIKYKSESKGKLLQSSSSDYVKFHSNLCVDCNGSKSQDADRAYQKLIEYYYYNQIKLLEEGEISLSSIYGDKWEDGIRNVYRYIAKHIGCRIAELGFLPSGDIIDFLNGEPNCDDLKLVFQLKPYQFGKIEDPIECIFIGPLIPINSSPFKVKDVITSFSGWYTFVNFTWNYLHEPGIGNINKFEEKMRLDIVDYQSTKILKINLKEETLERDWAFGLEKIEYYPFVGENRDLDYYDYMKKYI
ncbi:MAG: hypothetical protein ACJAT4_000986 [Granulosicoccus sp.]|jgi:hypothetical protein